MGIIFYAVIAACIFASGFGSAWKVEEWRYAAKAAETLHAQVIAQAAEDKRTNTIAARFEKAISTLRTNNAATDSKVLNELAKTVYTQCVVPASGVVLLDSSADDYNTASGLAPAVPADSAPAAKPTGHSNDGGSSKSARDLNEAIQRLRASAAGAKRSGSGSTSSDK